MDKVIIADGELRTSLAVIRSLSRHGLRVISIGRGKAGGYLTRYVYKKFDLSGSTDEEYINFIINTAKLEKVKSIFAHFEKTLLLLSDSIINENLPIKLILPDIEKYKFACNKENILRIANEIAIPVPQTIYYNYDKDQSLNEILKERIPCYIKAVTEVDIPPGPGSRYIALKNKEDFKNLQGFIAKHKSFFIQQYIDGYGCGIGGVFYNGKPVVVGGHIRLRESYRSGGVSTYCESSINKTALHYALRLMERLKWSGIGMIEFKVTPEGVPYFMEINPRIWGTIPLYIASGINIPVVAYEVFVNGRFDGLTNDFKEGVKMRFLIEDLQAISNQYNNFRKLTEYVKVFLNIHKVKEGIFELRDPLPFVMQIVSILKRRFLR